MALACWTVGLDPWAAHAVAIWFVAPVGGGAVISNWFRHKKPLVGLWGMSTLLVLLANIHLPHASSDGMCPTPRATSTPTIASSTSLGAHCCCHLSAMLTTFWRRWAYRNTTTATHILTHTHTATSHLFSLNV